MNFNARICQGVQVQACLSLLTALHAHSGSLQRSYEKEVAATSVMPWRREAVVLPLLLLLFLFLLLLLLLFLLLLLLSSSNCKLSHHLLSNMVDASCAFLDAEFSCFVS